MDRRIEVMLEGYLVGSLTAEREAEFERALESAGAATQRQVAAMARHARLIRQALRAEEMAPAPGFYARVIGRIEAQRQAAVTFWDLFLEPYFFKRLALAALTLLTLLSATMFLTPSAHEEALAEAPVIEMASEPEPIHVMDTANQESNRDVILATLATYEE